ncbi:Glyoxalase-like domain [Clostridium sp. ASBs410]|nr:Glyoxalase-like domain [Clostridium sp. ASBs410]
MSRESSNRVKINRINIVVDCADAGIMADFYSKLLGWEWTHPQANGWAAITSPTGSVIAFQEVEGYNPPVWPWEPEKQGQMLHLDLLVDNLDEGVKHAIECGAKEAGHQFFNTSRTMMDPSGHPFCIDTEEEETEQ